MKQYNFKINGHDYSVTINSVEGNIADVTVNASYKVELANGGSPAIVPDCGCSVTPAVARTPVAPVATPTATPQSSPAPQPASTPTPETPAPVPQPAPATTVPEPTPISAGGKGKDINSPLPGNIVAISVNIGDAVKAGQQVAVLEAMKMENVIESPVAGTVTAIHVKVGDAVPADAPIITVS